ncbi:DUF2190 family protein [uncultured Methylobacterium sp.]|uniref:DUF2190 family protein n=1 Tax=uncultured Methylobacterium sp. TaxID=157278 RepID=UPI0035CC8763
MKNYVQKGDILTVTAPSDVASGDGVIVGAIFGIAGISALSGADVEIDVEGVYDLPKVSAQPWTQGAAVYWDAAAKNVTTTSAGNTKIGVAVLAAANPSSVGRVRLNGTF